MLLSCSSLTEVSFVPQYKNCQFLYLIFIIVMMEEADMDSEKYILTHNAAWPSPYEASSISVCGQAPSDVSPYHKVLLFHMQGEISKGTIVQIEN